MNKLVLFLLLSVFLSCKNQDSSALNAIEIINNSIEASGGNKFDVSTITFDFRDKHYKAKRNQGDFQLERHFKDSIFNVKDVLDNNGFNRYVENESLEIPDSMVVKYAASVNSVHYFSVLPYGLNDPAVVKTFLGEEIIKGKNHYKIQVTFNKDGGGEDYEDVFVYWISTETFKVSYLAYSYKEIDDLGFRFREAYNERFVNGIRFVDYNNFKPKTTKVKVDDLGKLFEENQLVLLSKIELKNVTVN
ncbi:DUF6503 family protein [Xanthomarina sp. F2636L]|uniref:DUF6503 family protein n=1 Tax=Xanthomarina sp. F2636L TaxID=2996018 RepID=UPI00225E177C|nr:DUF6503 family protein [Xanthomarina sp. F2636L]MCX7552168.1 deoxyribose-phosphate aldolase [Xanthomarina sp. F2636L]